MTNEQIVGKYGCSDDGSNERSRLLPSIPQGHSARSDGIPVVHSISEESPDVYKSRWRSIRVMYFTMFLSSVSYSICMSSLYPYMKILDKTATTDFLGWVVAAYSVGQLMASPFFGFWSNYRSRTREPIVVSLTINIAANILYVYLESIPYKARIYLLVARIFIGFGAGNVAVVRSYVSGATTLMERNSAMAHTSACQAVGFILGPLIQTALVPIGFPGPVRKTALHFDMYTATGLISGVVSLLNIVFLFALFEEHRVHQDLSNRSLPKSSVQTELNGTAANKPDYWAVIPSICFFFSILFIFAVFETMATPYAMHMFAWKKSQATFYVGIILGCAGVLSILVCMLIDIVARRVNERYVLLAGLIVCMCGFGCYLPWGHLLPDIQYAEMSIPETVINNSVIEHITSEIQTNGRIFNLEGIGIETSSSKLPFNQFPNETTKWTANEYRLVKETEDISITAVPVRDFNHSNVEAVGCPYSYAWCMYTPRIFLWQFLLGTAFIATGYSTCSVMSYTMYSKILGPKPQGIWMGWLTAAGSLARTLGPVFVSQVYDAFGPRWSFSSLIGIIVVTIVAFIAFFKRLVPFGDIRRNHVQDTS